MAIRKTQLKSEAMNIQTCRMLADLATKEENLAVILGKDVISAILHLLHNFPHSASLQEEALRFLCTISIGCKEGKAAVFSNCRIPSVIQAMQFHGRSRGVQEMAVRLLASLMADNSWVEESAKFIRAAAAIGISRQYNRQRSRTSPDAARRLATLNRGASFSPFSLSSADTDPSACR